MIKKAAIISIGDELLLGQILDTNSTWISALLTSLGIEVYTRVVCPDDIESIISTLKKLSKQADLIITTGGLGPTQDDKTVAALCQYFGVESKRDPKSVERITHRLFAFLKNSITEDLLELNLRQADIPANASALDNPQGAAPGIWIEDSGTYYLSLPGVPLEVEAICNLRAKPLLEEFSPGNIQIYNIIISGIPESALSIKLQNFENNLPEKTSLAYLPRLSHIVLRLTHRGHDDGFEDTCRQLREYVGEFLLSEGDDILEVLMDLLHTKNLQITTAESCTGGGLASLICDMPGASAVYSESIVSYSNEVKIHKLGVQAETIATQGAVSEDTVIQMTQGQLQRTNADICVALSGILGPTGGSIDKPVGTTYIAIATREDTSVHRVKGRWDRKNNKKYVLDSSIILLIKKLKDY